MHMYSVKRDGALPFILAKCYKETRKRDDRVWGFCCRIDTLKITYRTNEKKKVCALC